MDTKSVTTETSDSGKPGSHEASSEIGIEEPSGRICLIRINIVKPYLTIPKGFSRQH